MTESESSSPPTEGPRTPDDFLIAGLGGSAGALEAFSELLGELPPECGAAVIVSQHLSSEHESLLVDLLSRVTKFKTQWASQGQRVRPGHVYVLPPKSPLLLRGGQLVSDEAYPAGRSGSTIDNLFRSLAEDAGHRAVGILCSGNGTDGVLGLKAIKAGGGMCFVQAPETAAFPAMPRAAVAADCVDGIFAPQEIARELAKLATRSRAAWREFGSPDVDQRRWETTLLPRVYRLLASRRGLDFTHYKQNTVKRRLLRRMLLTRTASLDDYVHLLESNPPEIDQLYESLLINVTEFFRDPDTFEYLGSHVLPALIRPLAATTPLRLWVPGCSTGEEVYSLAILVCEVMDRLNRTQPVQIFGTDISEQAIATARAGVFSAADVASLSRERVTTFFYPQNGRYEVHKVIRDMCVFARQNVVKDAPFSRLHLISCRNLLIYLDAVLQRKVIPIFHYALNPDGVLSLGSSESIGAFSDLFRPIARNFRIYARTPSNRRTDFNFPSGTPGAPAPVIAPPSPSMAAISREANDVIREADRMVVERHAPPGVVVTPELEILQFRGDVSSYLTPGSGRATLNLLRLARDGLAGEIQAAMLEAQESNDPVRREGLTLVHKDVLHRFTLDITPIKAGEKPSAFLVLFVPARLASAEDVVLGGPLRSDDNAGLLAQIARLKQELETAHTHLHSALEKHEFTSQEIRAANEQVQSSNEELQSTNEELETAKEELQSTNEELTTVNQELHSRHLEMIQLNNDLTNLINSVQLPIIILSENMRIRRFTPSAEQVLNLIPSDVGRPLSDINSKFKLPNLPQLVAGVMASLTVSETEVQEDGGKWFSIRIRPYKTSENKIEGAVISIIDIDLMKRAIANAEDARDISEAIMNTVSEPLVALDDRLEICSANAAFSRLFISAREQLNRRPFLDLLKNRQEADALRRVLLEVLPENTPLNNFTVHLASATPDAQEMKIHARQITRGTRRYPLILVSFHRADSSQG